MAESWPGARGATTPYQRHVFLAAYWFVAISQMKFDGQDGCPTNVSRRAFRPPRQQNFAASSPRRHRFVTQGAHSGGDVNLLTHLFINECELAPGSEWKDSSPGWKIILVSKGWLYWIARTEVKELKTGDILVVGPMVEGVLRASQISAAKLHFFFFQPEHLVGLMSLSERLSLDAFTVTAQTRILPADSAVAKEFADLTENASRRRSFFYRCRILHLVAMIFGDALPNVSQPRTNVATTLLRFEEIISRISDADLINYTSEQLSEMCGCSLRHFRRMFRKQFKTSIRAKQTELRLEKARQLLTETDDKTSTIAHAAGYNHLGFFNMMFKKKFGMTPTEWRRRSTVPERAQRAS